LEISEICPYITLFSFGAPFDLFTLRSNPIRSG
jgi:hypothetical protein